MSKHKHSWYSYPLRATFECACGAKVTEQEVQDSGKTKNTLLSDPILTSIYESLQAQQSNAKGNTNSTNLTPNNASPTCGWIPLKDFRLKGHTKAWRHHDGKVDCTNCNMVWTEKWQDEKDPADIAQCAPYVATVTPQGPIQHAPTPLTWRDLDAKGHHTLPIGGFGGTGGWDCTHCGQEFSAAFLLAGDKNAIPQCPGKAQVSATALTSFPEMAKEYQGTLKPFGCSGGCVWGVYEGLVERFEHCTKCGRKK